MSVCKSSFLREELLSSGPGVDMSWLIFRGRWCEVSGKLSDSGWSNPVARFLLNVLQTVTCLRCIRRGLGIPYLHLTLRPCVTKTPSGKRGEWL